MCVLVGRSDDCNLQLQSKKFYTRCALVLQFNTSDPLFSVSQRVVLIEQHTLHAKVPLFTILELTSRIQRNENELKRNEKLYEKIILFVLVLGAHRVPQFNEMQCNGNHIDSDEDTTIIIGARASFPSGKC